MRNRMQHRGPDSAGVWRSRDRTVVLAHRRLAVLDTSLEGSGAQPRESACGGFALVYNGEVYNDQDLRPELGIDLSGACDTPTVLEQIASVARAGAGGRVGLSEIGGALRNFRGMFALVMHDRKGQRLIVARDPMGLKPLCWWQHETVSGPEVVVASEPGAILAHPAHSARPDLVTVSAYLTTIRTTLGERTMFAGVRAVRPGEVIEFDLSRPGVIRHKGERFWQEPAAVVTGRKGDLASMREWAEVVGGAVRESVVAHLRSDVPACVLLSGGLDSTIIAKCCQGCCAGASRGAKASALGGALRTYAAGHDDGRDDSDLAYARLASKGLASTHREAHVTREMFAQRWPELVRRTGLPLSTPNQVAIHEIARTLRADGQIVALSGEGADELFGGYDSSLERAAAFERARGESAGEHEGGAFQLATNAWIPVEMKARMLRPEVWRALEQDATLTAYYREEFESCRASACADADPLEAHLRFHRRINLTGLLERLDSCAMLEGVEGRTPFADVRIAELASVLPMELKFRPAAEDGTSTSDAATRTKMVLREAFGEGTRDAVPREVLRRPKASFPLPFQGWLVDQAESVRRSEFMRELMLPAAIEVAVAEPQARWGAAWPMINLAMWAEEWWG